MRLTHGSWETLLPINTALAGDGGHLFVGSREPPPAAQGGGRFTRRMTKKRGNAANHS